MRMSDWSSDVCSSYLPEPFGEGDLQGRRDLLVAEEDDDFVMEGLQDFGEERVVHRLRQVDAEDLRAERARPRLDRDPGMGLTHRTDELRVGKACVSTFSSRGSSYH